jgi:hypothetical protein
MQPIREGEVRPQVVASLPQCRERMRAAVKSQLDMKVAT